MAMGGALSDSYANLFGDVTPTLTWNFVLQIMCLMYFYQQSATPG